MPCWEKAIPARQMRSFVKRLRSSGDWQQKNTEIRRIWLALLLPTEGCLIKGKTDLPRVTCVKR